MCECLTLYSDVVSHSTYFKSVMNMFKHINQKAIIKMETKLVSCPDILNSLVHNAAKPAAQGVIFVTLCFY